MFKKVKKPLEPIATVTVICPNGAANGLVESFADGKSVWRGLWKHHSDALRVANYKLHILFGHKFFHWVNVNNDKIWIKNEGGRNVAKFSEWNTLEGEIVFSKRRGRAIGIRITRIE